MLLIIMNINQLISIVNNKLENNIVFQSINVEDKTFLHKSHKNHKEGKFHIKITIKSLELKQLNKVQASKKIYNT